MNHHAMNAYEGIECLTEMSVKLLAPAALPLGKEPLLLIG
jgi:hypothetical protein